MNETPILTVENLTAEYLTAEQGRFTWIHR
jgi:hypothetical protein